MYSIGDAVVAGGYVKKEFKPLCNGVIQQIRNGYAEIKTDKGKIVKYAFSSIKKVEK